MSSGVGIASRDGPSLREVMVCAAPAALMALAILIPFLNGAFMIDDVTFLLEAKHVLIDPLHPSAFDMVMDGDRARVSHTLVTGPVMAYLLVPSVLAAGREWMAHSIEAGLLVVGIFGTVALGFRLGLDRIQAAIAACLVVISPAVIGMAATAMPDIPAMAFGVVGFERFVHWSKTRHWTSGLAAALLFSLASLSRASLLIALAACWIFAEERLAARAGHSGFKLKSIAKPTVPLFVSLALIAFVVLVTQDPSSGDTVAGAALSRVDTKRMTFNLMSFALNWAVAFPLALLWPLVRGRPFLNLPRTCVAYALAILLFVVSGEVGIFVLTGNIVPDFFRAFVILVILAHSIDVLIDIIGNGWANRDRTQLMLGAWLLIALPAATYAHLPPKVLVPAAPAMAILVARRFRWSELGWVRQRVFCAIGVAGFAFGFLVVSASTDLAEAGREGGRVAAQQVRQRNAVWFDGAWGFQWYAMQAGAQPLAGTPPFPRAGDIVVAGLQAKWIQKEWHSSTPLYRHVFDEPGGRVHSKYASFFTNRVTPWPWTWERDELGRIEVWRINSPP